MLTLHSGIVGFNEFQNVFDKPIKLRSLLLLPIQQKVNHIKLSINSINWANYIENAVAQLLSAYLNIPEHQG